MMRYGRLIERQRVGEIADADFMLGAIERSEDGEPVGIAEGLEELGLGPKVHLRDLGGRAATLHRHASMLCY